MQKIFACSIFLISLGCTNASSPENGSVKSEKADSTSKATIQSIACYERTSLKDTVHLEIENSNGTVTGRLSYRLFEKDANEGTLSGTMQGDTLIVLYTFGSEGKTSVRQVAFLKSESNLIEGFGPIKEEQGNFLFVSTDSLTFDPAHLLKPIPCSK